MKNLILTAIMLLLAGTASADDTRYTMQNGYIDVKQHSKYLEIKTSNSTLRVWPCGRVEKLEWKEIEPNRDMLIHPYSEGRIYINPVFTTPN